MSPDVRVTAGHMKKLSLEGKWVVDQVLSIRNHSLLANTVLYFSVDHLTFIELFASLKLEGVSWIL
jgi:hypothetical protein